MKITQDKRKKIEAMILKLIRELDPDPKGNIRLYKLFFKEMSSAQFVKWLQKLKDGKTKLFFYIPNIIKNIEIARLLTIADKFDTPLFHNLCYVDETGREIVTEAKHLVLKLPVRRVIQSLKNKVGFPKDDNQISQLTGSVIGKSKGARLDSLQIKLMMAKNTDNAVKEWTNVRGGNTDAYYEFKSLLANKGEVSLSELSSESRPRVLDSTSALLKAMHLDTNL